MSERNPSSGPLVEGPADPEHDPTASYALERRYVENLTRRLVATSGATAEVRSPLNDQPLAHVPQSTEADVDEAFRRARKAQEEWSRTSLDTRAAALLRFHDLVLARQAEVLDLICWRPARPACTPTKRSTSRWPRGTTAARPPHLTAAAAAAPSRHSRRSSCAAARAWSASSRPGTTRWSCPSATRCPPSLAGNAVVMKPDTETALTALWAARAARSRPGCPADVWQIVIGDGPVVGPAVVEHADYVSFTGSTRTGRAVAQRAAARLIGASLELGGKNALLVLRDADLDKAADGAVRACFSSAGQLCISIERLFVDEPVADALPGAVRRAHRGDAARHRARLGRDMGSLVGERQLETVTAPCGRGAGEGRHASSPAAARARPRPVLLRADHPGRRQPPNGRASPRRPSARSSRSTASATRTRRSRAPTTAQYGLNASIYSKDGRRGSRDRGPAARRHGQRQRGVRRGLRQRARRRWAA